MKLQSYFCVSYLCLYGNRQTHIFAKEIVTTESSLSLDDSADKLDSEIEISTRIGNLKQKRSQSAKKDQFFKPIPSKSSKKTKNKATKRKKKTKNIIDSIELEGSESARFESEEIKHHLGEGEQFLDFSELAKMKTFNLFQDRHGCLESEAKTISNENPYLNWTCFPLSLEEERNISSGYLDKRIANVIENAEDYPEEGTQLILDMQKFYCYLKHVNKLVVDKVKRGKKLMKELVEVDPHFTQIRFDTDELTDHFSWITEEAEAFEKIMDGICYQWKCLIGRNKH